MASGQPDPTEEHYDNIRQILGELIGCRLRDITQTDLDELSKDNSFIALHFDNGGTLWIPIDDVEAERTCVIYSPPGSDD